MKTGIRVIGIDDSPFAKKDTEVLIVGVIYRKSLVEGVLSTRIERDGNDSTGKILNMIKRSRFRDQLHAIFINSIKLGGFNIVDIELLSRELSLPVICVTRRNPDKKTAEAALKKLKDHGKKLVLLRKI
ncbi:DUF99 family protein, partial [Candidatus Micrarchaeota archaeon]|nr:DUF99 family protein [Candidatus Micrarchaeota archaeon]